MDLSERMQTPEVIITFYSLTIQKVSAAVLPRGEHDGQPRLGRPKRDSPLQGSTLALPALPPQNASEINDPPFHLSWHCALVIFLRLLIKRLPFVVPGPRPFPD